MRGFKAIRMIVSISLLLLFFWLTMNYFSYDLFLHGLMNLATSPILLITMAGGYFTAFWLRAVSWRMYLSREISIKHYIYGLFYSLFFNHLLPVKAGDLFRIGYLSNLKTNVSRKEIIESVIVMRIYDLLVLGTISLVFGSLIGVALAPKYFYIFVSVICFTLFVAFLLRTRILRVKPLSGKLVLRFISVRSAFIILIVALSWILESIVVYGTLLSFSIDGPVWQSIWINAITIAGQVFHFTPGGIGTYEATMSSALTATGVTPKLALQVAIISHLFKFVFSYFAGAYTLMKAPVSFRKVWLETKERG
ncbi:flippase-like domain-containing protein [Fictibacillus nanhaiensis]|uniref:lysylphosphatidylglycerol synthase transmembrane domain-containing protein n=1 Tax=Fictibacillus nanhaiensis TaxID=742169 RepID=UPI001C987F90|nr:lysylphosphatidylglycerol synthase transmembrane domain-containing protein [Fictibacillus nanhaiensis]MBY6035262.1 flippase-like domain-containing protein [Fictibacillus nanhaiensis]